MFESTNFNSVPALQTYKLLMNWHAAWDFAETVHENGWVQRLLSEARAYLLFYGKGESIYLLPQSCICEVINRVINWDVLQIGKR